MPIKFLPLPSQQHLLALFDYCSDSGELFWKVSAGTRRKPTEVAGSTNLEGYRIVRIDGQNFPAHRLIWKMQTGKDPQILDHISGGSNAWSNLRECTVSQNAANRRGPERDSASGYRGIRRRNGTYWEARVMCEGVRRQKTFPDSRYGGAQQSLLAARTWVANKRRDLFGEYAGKD